MITMSSNHLFPYKAIIILLTILLMPYIITLKSTYIFNFVI